MDIVKLRTLTKKSKVFFIHENTEKTVGDFLEKDHFKILKAYYTLEKISFTDEVLDILKSIYLNFYKIEKPGKDLNFKKHIFTNIDYTSKTYKELLAMIRALRINNKFVPDVLITAFGIAKKEREKTKDNMDLNVSKLSLQGKNQGH